MKASEDETSCVRISKKVRKKAKLYCAKNETSLRKFIDMLIENHLKEQRKPKEV